MDYNLVALRSYDSLIYDPETKPAIMGRQWETQLCNALIMAKPKAPFIRQWLEAYETFSDDEWDYHSGIVPLMLYDSGAEVTILDPHAWFDPPPGRGLHNITKLWFGQSFWDIDINFGVHQWRYHSRTESLLTPDSVREIDAPFFCRISHLFDDVDGQHDTADWRSNPNCTVAKMESLVNRPTTGLMASYDFSHDTTQKWIDSSGNKLHGWDPYGTGLLSDNGQLVREFRKDTFAVLPVPHDYDCRAGTVESDILFQVGHSENDTLVRFLQLRFDETATLVLRFRRMKFTKLAIVQAEWASDWDGDQTFNYSSSVPISLFDDRYHTLRFAWDRKGNNRLAVQIDGLFVLDEQISPLIDQLATSELWLNGAREWDIDGGLRARLRYLKVYSEAIFTKHERLLNVDPSTRSLWFNIGFSSQLAFLVWISMFMALLIAYVGAMASTENSFVLLLRQVRRAGQWYASRIGSKRHGDGSFASILYEGVRGRQRNGSLTDHALETMDEQSMKGFKTAAL